MRERTYSSASYRFGFNGQEKDDEVAGSGNINTAEYWEYDCRLGRRWNMDPKNMYYAFRSTYLTFSNNPLIMVDPGGDDDYFNQKGEFLGSDGDPNNHNIRIINIGDEKIPQLQNLYSDETNKIINAAVGGAFSIGVDLFTTTGNENAFYLIITHYSEAQIKDYSPGSKDIEKIIGGGIIVASTNNKKGLANTSEQSIKILSYNGFIQKEFYNYYNLINSLSHEKSHRNDHLNGKKATYENHGDVYIEQTKHWSWKFCTIEHQRDVVYGALLRYTRALNDNIDEPEDLTRILGKLAELQKIALKAGITITYNRDKFDGKFKCTYQENGNTTGGYLPENDGSALQTPGE